MRVATSGARQRALLDALVAWTPECVHEWHGGAAVRERLSAVLNEQLARCTDLEFGAFFTERLGRGTPRDYLQREIVLERGLVLCGPRLFGGDPSKPFVEIVAHTCPLRDAVDAALEAYPNMRPSSVRVEWAGQEPPDVDGDVYPDTLVFAEVARRVAASGMCIVAMADAQLEPAKEFVATSYATFKARHPELIARVPEATHHELQECIDEGRLVWWTIDGQVAGLLGVRRDRHLALEGMLIVEECVSPDWAGRGAATEAQRALARSPPGDVVIFGTIDAANAASRRTAERAGRRAVSRAWFISRGRGRP